MCTSLTHSILEPFSATAFSKLMVTFTKVYYYCLKYTREPSLVHFKGRFNKCYVSIIQSTLIIDISMISVTVLLSQIVRSCDMKHALLNSVLLEHFSSCSTESCDFYPLLRPWIVIQLSLIGYVYFSGHTLRCIYISNH